MFNDAWKISSINSIKDDSNKIIMNAEPIKPLLDEKIKEASAELTRKIDSFETCMILGSLNVYALVNLRNQVSDELEKRGL